MSDSQTHPNTPPNQSPQELKVTTTAEVQVIKKKKEDLIRL